MDVVLPGVAGSVGVTVGVNESSEELGNLI